MHVHLTVTNMLCTADTIDLAWVLTSLYHVLCSELDTSSFSQEKFTKNCSRPLPHKIIFYMKNPLSHHITVFMNQTFNLYGFASSYTLSCLNGCPVITQVECAVYHRDKIWAALRTFKIHITSYTQKVTGLISCLFLDSYFKP